MAGKQRKRHSLLLAREGGMRQHCPPSQRGAIAPTAAEDDGTDTSGRAVGCSHSEQLMALTTGPAVPLRAHVPEK